MPVYSVKAATMALYNNRGFDCGFQFLFITVLNSARTFLYST